MFLFKTKNLAPFIVILVSLNFIFFVNQSRAQRRAILRIVAIAEKDGSPLPGANVTMFDARADSANREILYHCVTNTSGLCEIRNIRPNQFYTLNVSYIGYKTYQKVITFSFGEVLIERATLKTSVAEIEEVTVESKRYITTGEVGLRRISTIDISSVPTPGVDGDLASYLQTEPGVVTTGDRGGNLFIRGGTPDQNLVLVDNLPIYKPFHISNLFSAFPDDILQTADLYAGGFGGEYIGITSAVVDINLKPGNFKETVSRVTLSPYLSSLHVEGPVKENVSSYNFQFRKSFIDQFGTSLAGEEIPLDFYDLIGRFSIQKENVTCNVTGIRTYDSGKISYERNLAHSWANTVIGTRCIGFDEDFKYPVEATAGFSHFRNSESVPGETQRLSIVRKAFFNFQLQEDFLGLQVDYGIGLNFDSYKSELNEQFTNLESFSKNVPLTHIYAKTVWQPTRWLTLEPSVASLMTFDILPSMEPRLRISVRPDGTDRQEISLAGGRYTQIVAGISDQRDVGSTFTVLHPIDEDEKAITSWQGLAGYKQDIGNSLNLNLEGYVKTIQHYPVAKWNPNVGIETETALANGFVYGFDTQISFERNRLYVSLGYGWSKVEYEADTGDLGAWIEEPVFEYAPAHDQRHKFNSVASYRFAGFTANVRWELGSGHPYTRILGFDRFLFYPQDFSSTPGRARILFNRPYNARLPYYHRLDVSLSRSFQLSENWFINAEVGTINVYDRNNIFSFDYYVLQRVDQTPLLPYMAIRVSRGN